MQGELSSYIKTKRTAGLADDQIRANLIASGWQIEIVDAGLKADLDADVPAPPSVASAAAPTTDHPISVVNVATTRGIEYLIMFIGLWISATGIGFLLHSGVDTMAGREGYAESIAPYAAAAIIVALPIFAILFLRLKKAELTEPTVRSDPSRKRAIQLTLIVTFLIGIFKIISYIFSLINGGDSSGFLGGSYDSATAVSPVFDLIHTAITLAIAGGIFTYYWRDIHKKEA